MDSRYPFNGKGSETEKTKETFKSSPEAAPKSEKRHASLAEFYLMSGWKSKFLTGPKTTTQALRLLVLTTNDGFFDKADKAIKAWTKYDSSYFVFY